MVGLLVGFGQVGQANTGDGVRCVVGKETISLRQVCVCDDDHYGSRNVHVQTLVSSC